MSTVAPTLPPSPASKACESCGVYRSSSLKKLGIGLETWDYVVALAGNPNTGKSTVFNALTGLRQHTGNWPGKTVARAEGGFQYDGKQFKMVDLPGTYSLLSTSLDEQVARDFLLFGRPDVTVIVADAARLERNLNLALQVLEITDRVVVCLNLMDEAQRHGIKVDERQLARELGVPVVVTSARFGRGLPELLQAIHDVASGKTVCRPHRLESEPAAVKPALSDIMERLRGVLPKLPNPRWVALRLLGGDDAIVQGLRSGELADLGSDLAPSAGAQTSRSADSVPPESGSTFTTSAASPSMSERGHSCPPGINAPRGADKNVRAPTQAIPDAPENVSSAPGAPVQAILDAAQTWRGRIPGDLHEHIVEAIYQQAAHISNRVVSQLGQQARPTLGRTMDRIVTSRIWGFPIMMLLFAVMLWLTITGANYPSSLISRVLVDLGHPWLKSMFVSVGSPWWLTGLVVDGMYLATAWVVSVMLPPMAIFFPLFTLLEDLGYLPRIAFNLDRFFKASGAHGKQAMTTMMGFGCNAAGVVATRIIDSPRERLLAILTNNFALCNGRWPTQFLIATVFIGALVPASLASVVAAGAVTGVAMLGILMTLIVGWTLSRTVLRGEVSTFSLELPPYRPPRFWQTLYTSLIDRTLFVLWRAIVFALPAGAAIWLCSNIRFGGDTLAGHFIHFANPLGLILGLNGVILLAYIIAIPANEIVIPTILMLTAMVTGAHGVGQGAGVMFELDSNESLKQLLSAGGWTLLTAVNLMLFSLLHNPCSTTLYTIYKETGSAKWTAVAALMPLAIGFAMTFLVAMAWRMAG
jgi:ferrous iron transport protein B